MDTYENKNPGEDIPEKEPQILQEQPTPPSCALNDQPSEPSCTLNDQPECVAEEACFQAEDAAAEVFGEAENGPEMPDQEPVQNPVEEEQKSASQTYEPIYPNQPRSYGRTSPYENSPYVMNRPVRSKARRKKSGFWKGFVCTVLILALVVGACGATAYVLDRQWQQKMNRMEDDFQEQLQQMQQQIKFSGNGVSISGSPNTSADGGLTPSQVYAQNVKSVVMINNLLANGTATGSGFILSENGYVVTNHHVIEGGIKFTVVTYDGREFPAKLIGSDSTNDVALLKMEAENLQPVTLGNSDDLIVGDQVAAIGNPLGELTSTLTVGYISAKERDVNTEGFAINMLQTDAAINSGNSGGPLFNMKGEVIGITTAKFSGTSSSGASIEGVGFAIPINDVSDLLSDLMNYGYVTGAYLGVRVSDMDPVAASYYNMPVGVYVQSVDDGFAAERGGIRAKDIIVKIGDIEVKTVNDLTRALRRFSAGDEVNVVVYRSGAEKTLRVTLDPKPDTPQE